jgi:hypothetical protein
MSPSRPPRKYFIENICNLASGAEDDDYRATHKEDAQQEARTGNVAGYD